jgi:multidrug efflux pump subunit AcrA (membrane-fusion protein)
MHSHRLRIISLLAAGIATVTSAGCHKIRSLYENPSPAQAAGTTPDGKKAAVTSSTDVPEVALVTVRTEIPVSKSSYLGEFASERDFKVPTEMRGQLVEQLVRQGQTVRKGQELGKINPLVGGIAMNHYILRAPIDGIVAIWFKDTGALVQESEPMLRIYDPKRMKTRIFINEEDRMQLQGRSPESDDLKWSMRLSASGQAYEAKIKVHSIAAVMDPETLTFPTDLQIISDKNPALGTWITVILEKTLEPQLFVPKTAIAEIDGVKKVARVDGDVLSWIPVVTATETPEGQDIRILEGLTADMEIMSKADRKLPEGQRIAVSKQEIKSS